MQKTLGGDRLGSGQKMTVELHNYGRSTHNLSRAWRSSMAPGTLVPFFVEPALNGDTFDIDVAGLVRTLPTIGPLFGSFKLQMDFFVAPMRLYNKQLHNNKLGIGMEMSKVKFPQISLFGRSPNFNLSNPNAQQINPSSIASYLGIRGLGNNTTYTQSIERKFNAQPFLAYWDIFKNYYANKQEENAYVIHNQFNTKAGTFIESIHRSSDNQVFRKINGDEWIPFPGGGWAQGNHTLELTIIEKELTSKVWDEIIFRFTPNNLSIESPDAQPLYYSVKQLHQMGMVVPTNNPNHTNPLIILVPNVQEGHLFFETGYDIAVRGATNELSTFFIPKLESFPLKNIDDMREAILGASNDYPFDVTLSGIAPYELISIYHFTDPTYQFKIGTIIGEMEGLAVKTYQSDRFNNWLGEDAIMGANGIAEVTKIDTSDGLKLDALNLAQKIHNMLVRISISGGSYHNWQEAVYGEIVNPIPETPWFAGGTSQEITFSEVTSTAETDEYNPLGTLAGKGYSQGNSKHIHIRIQEPSYIIGIVSITPRIDYSQGNKWFVNLETMDDLHKPALDAIGFQALITDEMAAIDTIAQYVDDLPATNFKSAGRQPSWIHYMTSQNECYGTFAEPLKEMYMTLARQYSFENQINNGIPTAMYIKDLTTYIDPEKFNYNFARKDLGAQNFWVQLGIECTARRKMSAKQIPNL